MKKSKFSEKQITYALREIEAGRSPRLASYPREIRWMGNATRSTRLQTRGSERISFHRGSRFSQTSQCDRSRYSRRP